MTRALLELLQRNELFARKHIVKDGMTLTERAPLGVLAGEPDRNAVGEDGGERELLGCRPIDAFRAWICEHVPSFGSGSLELRET